MTRGAMVSCDGLGYWTEWSLDAGPGWLVNLAVHIPASLKLALDTLMTEYTTSKHRLVPLVIL